MCRWVVKGLGSETDGDERSAGVAAGRGAGVVALAAAMTSDIRGRGDKGLSARAAPWPRCPAGILRWLVVGRNAACGAAPTLILRSPAVWPETADRQSGSPARDVEGR